MEENSKYYRATGDALAALVEFNQQREEAWREINKFLRKIKAVTQTIKTDTFGGSVVAVRFRQPPDAALWSEFDSDGKERFWCPKRKTKEGKDLANQMDKLILPGSQMLTKKFTGDIGIGVGVGARFLCGVYVLEVCGNFKSRIKGLVELKRSEYWKLREDDEAARAKMPKKGKK